MVAQVARLTRLDKIKVGDKIYSKVIFNSRQAQAAPPSQQEFIQLDNGAEFRFYEDGTIYFKDGVAEPICLFDGLVWLEPEVLVSGTVSAVFLHKDPVNGIVETEGAYDPQTAHPHVNYGWFDKASSPDMTIDFKEKEEYENSGLPNEAFVIMTKRLALVVQNLAVEYVKLRNEFDEFNAALAANMAYIDSWASPDYVGYRVDYLRRTGYADWGRDDDTLWAAVKTDYDNSEQIFETYYIAYCEANNIPESERISYMPEKYVFDWNNLGEDGKPTIILNPRYLHYHSDAVLNENDESYQELVALRTLMDVNGATASTGGE